MIQGLLNLTNKLIHGTSSFLIEKKKQKHLKIEITVELRFIVES